MSEFTIDQLKAQWNAVLDALLAHDRIAWLAFFDARLVSLDGSVLRISFVDAQKFGGDHDFSLARNPKHIALLQDAITEATGHSLEIQEMRLP